MNKIFDGLVAPFDSTVDASPLKIALSWGLVGAGVMVLINR